jgi:hypothetical protein
MLYIVPSQDQSPDQSPDQSQDCLDHGIDHTAGHKTTLYGIMGSSEVDCSHGTKGGSQMTYILF